MTNRIKIFYEESNRSGLDKLQQEVNIFLGLTADKLIDTLAFSEIIDGNGFMNIILVMENNDDNE